MPRRDMQKCGFCSFMSGLLRRAMCVRSRRGSSDSYYRELGDQDTLKIEDKSSDLSNGSDNLIQHMSAGHSQDSCPVLDNMAEKNLNFGKFSTINKRRKQRLLTRSLCTEEALLDDLYLGQVQCILDRSINWRFNAFTLDNVSAGHCLSVFCVHLFHSYGLVSHFNLDMAKAWKLFSLIEEGYHSSNPYHNSIHATDVTQAMHCFLQQTKIREHLEPLELMATLLAAIGHDLDHPGVNQPFLIATSNHLAALYKNTSVLENHHWRSAVSCLIESGLLEHMQGLKETLIKQMSSLILATDITRQQEYLVQFKGHLDNDTLDMTKSEHRHLVLQIALKCADISNPCRPWDISRKWSLKVCEEFFRQGDYERKLNLPVTALCDRHTTSIPKIQTGFFQFVVTPLITEWHRFLHNELSGQMLENLQYNKAKWEMLVAKEIAEETRTEISDAEIFDDEMETGTNISDDSELLLPRRSSLNPAKQGGTNEQLRRFSVPLNMLQDTKFKNRGRTNDSTAGGSRSRGNASPLDSEHSLHSQLSLRGRCVPHHKSVAKMLITEILMPDSSITSITTTVQASRLNVVLKEGGTWRLVRQQTFPPLVMTARDYALAIRPLYMSNEDTIYSTCSENFNAGPKRDDGNEGACSSHIATRNDTDESDKNASQNNSVDVTEHAGDTAPENNRTEPESSERRTRSVGSQLRDNLSLVTLASSASDHLLQRRQSMPSDIVVLSPKERRVCHTIQHFLRRTSSWRDARTQRRGSAPAPIAPSDLQASPSTSGGVRQSTNGARRKQTPVGTCQQSHARTTYNVQEGDQPRRGSLPVEVMTGIFSY